jgi:hypothetical protein
MITELLSRRIEMINQKLEALVGLLEKIAADKHDGHVTLFKFSTGWKVFEGTPTLLWPDCAVLAQMEPHESLSEALAEFVRTRPVPVDRSLAPTIEVAKAPIQITSR